MAERRRGNKRRQQEIPDKPTKEETAVAKHLRFKVPTKDGKLVGLPVKYFIGAEAVNCLMESKWSANNNKTSPLFTNRASCVDYCQKLLLKGMFHRATKVERKKDKSKTKKKKTKDDVEESSKKDKEKSEKVKREKKAKSKKAEGAEKKEESEEDKKAEADNDKDDKKDEEKKKRKKERKTKLEMADNQSFRDGDEELYVWIYDPWTLKTFVIGLFLVVGAIGICLFPLWPPEVRLGVYYLSLLVAGLIGLLLALCVFRVILFGFIWILTLGRHHFWFLPNINEDVGFFDSFRPLYHHEAVTQSWGGGGNKKTEDKKEKGKHKKDDDEEDEDEEDDGGNANGSQEKLSENNQEQPDDHENPEDVENARDDQQHADDRGEADDQEYADDDENGSENDVCNDYEIVDKDEGQEQDFDTEPKKDK